MGYVNGINGVNRTQMGYFQRQVFARQARFSTDVYTSRFLRIHHVAFSKE